MYYAKMLQWGCKNTPTIYNFLIIYFHVSFVFFLHCKMQINVLHKIIHHSVKWLLYITVKLGGTKYCHSVLSLDCHSSSLHILSTVKTLGLLQPYFGHLSCMPVVYVICYTLQTSKDASNLIQSVVEKLLYFTRLGFPYRRPINQHFW